jgi:hypothetical protein
MFEKMTKNRKEDFCDYWTKRLIFGKRGRNVLPWNIIGGICYRNPFMPFDYMKNKIIPVTVIRLLIRKTAGCEISVSVCTHDKTDR